MTSLWHRSAGHVENPVFTALLFGYVFYVNQYSGIQNPVPAGNPVVIMTYV
jgi:hypothetical protein